MRESDGTVPSASASLGKRAGNRISLDGVLNERQRSHPRTRYVARERKSGVGSDWEAARANRAKASMRRAESRMASLRIMRNRAKYLTRVLLGS